MPSYTQYRDPTDTTRTPSPVIWADCPTMEMLHNPAAGYHFFDDFINLEAMGTTATYYSKYYIAFDTGGAVSPGSNKDLGEAYVNPDGTANDGIMLAHGAGAGFARFGANPGDKVWFETRIKTATITDGDIAFYVGFMDTSTIIAANTGIPDGGATPITSQDLVGFWTDISDGDVCECIYQEAATGSYTNVGDCGTAWAVDTYTKLGLKYDGRPWHDGTTDYTGGKLVFYQNGAVQQTLGITTSLSFPDTNHLCMVLMYKDVTGTATDYVTLDWWRCAAVGGNT